jgi:hypothetical protein
MSEFSPTGDPVTDVILDFHAAQDDIIDLSAIDARKGGGDNAFTFIGTAAFSGAKGQLRYQDPGDDLLVQGDTNGDGVADISLLLARLSPLGAGDFVL